MINTHIGKISLFVLAKYTWATYISKSHIYYYISSRLGIILMSYVKKNNFFKLSTSTISTIIINYQATKILFLNIQKHTTLPNNSKQVNNREEKKIELAYRQTTKRRPTRSWHQQKVRLVEGGPGLPRLK